MYAPNHILPWLEENVKMRQSRRKTLAAIVSGAMRLNGVGVLALGRAMNGPAKAKHRIKRVDRFWATKRLKLMLSAKPSLNSCVPPPHALSSWRTGRTDTTFSNSF